MTIPVSLGLVDRTYIFRSRQTLTVICRTSPETLVKISVLGRACSDYGTIAKHNLEALDVVESQTVLAGLVTYAACIVLSGIFLVSEDIFVRTSKQETTNTNDTDSSADHSKAFRHDLVIYCLPVIARPNDN